MLRSVGAQPRPSAPSGPQEGFLEEVVLDLGLERWVTVEEGNWVEKSARITQLMGLFGS